MKSAERIKAIASLPVPAQIALAARSGERALNEVRRLHPEVDRAYPALQQGVDLIWRHALNQDVDFHQHARPIHSAISKLHPMSPDDPVPDQALQFASQAIALGLIIALEPLKTAKYAASAANSIINLVGCVYENVEEVQEKERQWQVSAIEFLLTNGTRPITRSMFDGIPEYDRGPVSEEYIEFGGPE